jgi:hypothetical protein
LEREREGKGGEEIKRGVGREGQENRGKRVGKEEYGQEGKGRGGEGRGRGGMHRSCPFYKS